MNVIQQEQESPILLASQLKYDWAGSSTPIINIDSWQVKRGESWCLYGPSGCGKSTLLNLITGVIKPCQGSLALCGQDLSSLKSKAKDRFRADHIGYVFQQFNLLPYLSPIKNVMLSTQFSKRRNQNSVQAYGSIMAEAKHWLNTLSLPESLWQGSVMELSLGQQQRVAAARALMGNPEIIIADEPTSALDPINAKTFIETLKAACSEQQTTLILVSHDPAMQSQFSHVWSLTQGQPS